MVKMFVIMAYDVNVERVTKVLHVGRRYLNWVQNSLLEGELTNAQFARLKADLHKIINEEEDSVVFYVLRRQEYLDKQILGLEKGGQTIMI
ncbi:CRISPR-associated protein Cas2 [Acetomicrobium hydrogeniformans ATCC BAA-1850]|uniref:CRISPR-associated endoribonuclease Cas2 n=2 Tax=Acetomicrobium hydrogeniformans TaxID=649746 RepID=A0A0T5X8K1_9BACT|nr:CRISPR-associated protein Cas2 [Acetomicrobium hydrogeniformans ATCC BAA-1850]